ncbi:G2/mitotic-specific cyclin-B3 isoform X2 [Toxorhynchites rutilus septentrionalis]|uniref:G2/mitotic-specific cyclin-B3 isoform X2 n=1 Tax=Toxorhynchites rutilus septentrionalis TaxID=329112 RepID=UPI002478523B|nr:G2/mitotic-specific cyclin-B3 isoform X2 [Toxorhynchites rutilus septentrionalis]
MAPAKQNETTALLPTLRKTITTRSKASAVNQNQNGEDHQPLQRGKRKAEHSPAKNERGVKRSALGNLTNAVVLNTESDSDGGPHMLKGGKGVTTGTALSKQASQLIHQLTSNIVNNKKIAPSKTTEVFTKPDPNAPRTRAATKILTRAASRQQLSAKNAPKNVVNNRTNIQESAGHPLKSQISNVTTTIVKTKDATFDGAKPQTTAAVAAAQQGKPKRRISNEFEKTEDSLYMSALEDIPSSGSLRLSEHFGSACSVAVTPVKGKNAKDPAEKDTSSARKRTPDGVEDYDLMNWNDPYQVSHYAQDIFTYQQERESQFIIPDYMEKQPHISKWMRALLVDWMVEIQESFELNHETLYLAVKIVDIYLSRAEIEKESLQLLGAAALFIASKFDERVPPTVDDFHYICDGAYLRREMILMEIKVFKTIGYDLGIPLSYRFLRRYARVNRIDMPVLTLARYILEFSLMDYATIQLRDSKLACAALFIAMRMNNMPGWNKTLEFYSGFKIEDFAEIAILLNNIMTRKPKESLNTIRHKYSHELFFESAKKPFITDLSKLFDTTGFQFSSIQASTGSATAPAICTRSQSATSGGATTTTTTTTV